MRLPSLSLSLIHLSLLTSTITLTQGDTKHSHKPLHLKHYCQPGQNLLEITVSTCCCVSGRESAEITLVED